MNKLLAIVGRCVLGAWLTFSTSSASTAKPIAIPEKLVVLTFDDGNKSDLAFVAPILKRHGFRATFFITEGLGFTRDKETFLTWGEVRQLADMGFEIGNHTRSHPNCTRLSREGLVAELEYMEQRCKEHGIPMPSTFAYPGWQHSRQVVEVLRQKGYRFARRGSAPEVPNEQDRGVAYEPGVDHPLLVPTTGASGPNWGWDEFLQAVHQARDGKICVLAFHGVPARIHPWVTTKPADFKRYMQYLHDEGFKVIAMRDLTQYVDPAQAPSDPYAPIQQRLRLTPTELKCEYLVNPLGIDVAQPRLSWLLRSYRRGQKQTAYQVLVASSPDKLARNVGDKWDTGKVLSDQSVHTVYQGKPLSSREPCWWKVRVWDQDDQPSPYSPPATFEMGLLQRTDWKAKWIQAGSAMNYTAGKFGQAVRLNGVSETIRIPPYPGLKPDRQITICAWVKPTAALGTQPRNQADNWREIYRKEDGNARQLLALGKTGDLEGVWLGLGVDGAYVERGAPLPLSSLKDGQWHFIAGTYDGSAMKFYADSRLIGRAAVSGRLDRSGSAPAYIGSSGGDSEFFPGGIDEVRIYRRALSAMEIRALAEKPIGRDREVAGWWKLDGNLSNSAGGQAGQSIGARPSAPLLRKEFTLVKPVKRARVYMSGLGWSELYVNGRKVGDRVLDPATTYYHNDQPFPLGSRVLYVTHDVTTHLQSGGNALGVMLGNGWYSHDGPSPGREPYADSPILLLQLHIEFTDGTSLMVASDPSWKVSAGPITANEICLGEHYDARREQPGWAAANYDDSGWSPAVPAEPPSGKLVAQKIPPVKVIQTLKPVKLTRRADGVYVYDFGQHFSGWSRLRVRGPRGAKVTLRHAGALTRDGRLDTRNQRGAPQTDSYILKGEGVEVWEPRFTLHGFRYVEMAGFPGQPALEHLEGRFVRNAVEVTGRFECSNPLLNQIHSNVLWTFMTSLQGIPQDAADRSERVAWLGDPGFVAEDYLYNLDTAAFWAKWLDDIRDSQKPDGDLPVVSPLHWRRIYTWYPCWKSTYPLFVWYLHQYYGDERVLAEHYDGIKQLVEFLGRKAKGHLVPDGLGDHMEPDRAAGKSNFAPKRTPGTLTSTAYYYFDTWILAQAAKIIGRADDARHYAELAQRIKQAFIEKFFDEQANQCATGSQTANALALYLGLVPEGRELAVLSNLVNNIRIKNKGHLATGILGANALEQVLGEHGRPEVMYTIATQTTYPSWGYTIAKGATTVWESFEDNDHSLNMKMFGSTEKFFYKDLAGIALVEPGFRRLAVRPRPVDDLTDVRASFKTIRGQVAVDWQQTDRSFEMKVTLPPNTAAEVSVPTLGLSNIAITESGKPVWNKGAYRSGVEGIGGGRQENGYVTFEVGSGHYRFRLAGEGK